MVRSLVKPSEKPLEENVTRGGWVMEVRKVRKARKVVEVVEVMEVMR